MSDVKDYLSGSINPKNIYKTIEYNIKFARDNPDYFYPDGIWLFSGPQGSGKTLSMVNAVKLICKDYPKAIIVSNLEINGLDRPIIPFEDYEQIKNTTNDIYGVIFIVDEIGVVWSAMESKNIPVSEMACFCQNRKNRRLVLCTTQNYQQIATCVRRQLKYIIVCKNYFNVIQVNTITDPSEAVEESGHKSVDVIGHKIWFHSPELYKSYNTLYKIEKPQREKETKKNRRYF